MKTKITLFFLLIFVSFTGFCTVWTVNNSGNTFVPAIITITLGDTVVFALESVHNAAEVSQLTWNANGSILLSGGFQTAFGGGVVLPAQLNVGTHYYICEAHISMGMKGIINVQNPLNIKENLSQANFSINPNPCKGKFQFIVNEFDCCDNYSIDIYNLLGEKVSEQNITELNSEIDLSHQPKGIYFVKIDSGNSILTKKIIIQ
jgi:plastocyanin